MDSVAIWFSSDDDSDTSIENHNPSVQRRILRDNSNIFELSNKMFKKHFRLSKEAFSYVLNEIKDDLKPRRRSTAVPNVIKLAATLRFLAEGGYQHGTGEEIRISVAQQTISDIISEVCSAIENKICPNAISFMSQLEKREEKQFFFNKFGFPVVIGAIDGTHIQIIRPHKDEHLYFNRKQKHSVNAMVICDHNMRIRSADARFGGSSHDSHVWSLRAERKLLENTYRNGDKSSWLLGDSGYPLEPWLLTPYRVALEGTPEAKFNIVFSKLRNIIERVFGILKGRFRCLLSARELHYSPQKAIQIFNVCCALHNICLDFKIPFEINEELHEDYENIGVVDQLENASLLTIGKKIRDNIKELLV